MGRDSKISLVSHMIARSQLVADNMVLSSAIACDHDRRIADDRRSVFPYDRKRSQNFLRSAIVCDHMEISFKSVPSRWYTKEREMAAKRQRESWGFFN